MATDRIILPGDPVNPGRNEATRSRTEDGNIKHWSRVIVEDNRIRTFRGAGSTFRIPGVTTTAHNLWSIENAAGSTILVALKKLHLYVVNTAVSALVINPALFRLTTLPTGGTPFTKTSVDPRDAASNASVVVRGGASVDGTAGTVITATAAGQRLTSALLPVMVTSGVYPATVIDMLEGMDGEFLLGASQSYLLQIPGGSNTAFHYIVNCEWEEFTEF